MAFYPEMQPSDSLTNYLPGWMSVPLYGAPLWTWMALPLVCLLAMLVTKLLSVIGSLIILKSGRYRQPWFIPV